MSILTETQQTNVNELLQALRSGNFKQAQNLLRTGTEETGFSYCCIGLACHLHRPDLFVMRQLHPHEYGDSLEREVLSWDGKDNNQLPLESMQVLYGFTVSFTRQLARLNDAGTDFSKIADVIEYYAKTGEILQ